MYSEFSCECLIFRAKLIFLFIALAMEIKIAEAIGNQWLANLPLPAGR